jgi:hypothetical protein
MPEGGVPVFRRICGISARIGAGAAGRWGLFPATAGKHAWELTLEIGHLIIWPSRHFIAAFGPLSKVHMRDDEMAK